MSFLKGFDDLLALLYKIKKGKKAVFRDENQLSKFSSSYVFKAVQDCCLHSVWQSHAKPTII